MEYVCYPFVAGKIIEFIYYVNAYGRLKVSQRQSHNQNQCKSERIDWEMKKEDILNLG